MDTAVNHLKDDYDAVIFIEPDCWFTSDVWHKNIIESLESGKSMACIKKYSHGPHHPCGSGWIIKDIPGSFEYVEIDIKEVLEDKFPSLIDIQELFVYMIRYQHYFHVNNWDTGLRNWFLLALENKVELVKDEGIQHYWRSSCDPPTKEVKYSQLFKMYQ